MNANSFLNGFITYIRERNGSILYLRAAVLIRYYKQERGVATAIIAIGVTTNGKRPSVAPLQIW